MKKTISSFDSIHCSLSKEDAKYYIGQTIYIKGDTLYIQYNTKFRWSSRLIILGYFEKLKQLYIGKTYEFYNPGLVKTVDNFFFKSADTVKHKLPGMDIATRNGTIWKCTDIALEDGNNYDIVAVLHNDQLGSAYAKLDEIPDENYSKTKLWLVEKNKMNEDIFGKETFELIKQKRLRIGMERNACLFSWGEPNDIVRSTTKDGQEEKWTYKSGESLLFKKTNSLRSLNIDRTNNR